MSTSLDQIYRWKQGQYDKSGRATGLRAPPDWKDLSVAAAGTLYVAKIIAEGCEKYRAINSRLLHIAILDQIKKATGSLMW